MSLRIHDAIAMSGPGDSTQKQKLQCSSLETDAGGTKALNVGKLPEAKEDLQSRLPGQPEAHGSRHARGKPKHPPQSSTRPSESSKQSGFVREPGMGVKNKGQGDTAQKKGSKPTKGAAGGATPKKQHKGSVFDKKFNPPFEGYWRKEDVQRGLKRGELVQGAVRINQKNFEEAFIDDPEGGPDYFIQGLHNRNRSFQNDVVVVQVLPQDQWVREEQAHLLLTDEVASLPGTVTSDISHQTTQLSMEGPLPPASGSPQSVGDSTMASGVEKLNLTCSLSTAGSVANAGEKTPGTQVTPTVHSEAARPQRETLIDRLYSVPSDGKTTATNSKNTTLSQRKESYKYRRTVKVVYITERGHSRACAGYLKAFDKSKGLALFSPKDNKVPRVVIPLTDCPEDYCQNPKKFVATLFICRIQDWPDDSPFAQGVLMRSLGEAGEIEPETESFLIENEIDSGDFPPEALECLPKVPWTIPKEEESTRRDFRKECVFSIDPDTARDLDDALHIKKVDEDVFELGVHIADVSYFVQAGTPLDDIASQRATSVYLVQKVIPMLPRLLCEELCSLNPDEDRLTFSVVWRVTGKGEFLSEWMGRSIICSCAKLSYDHAQLMIDHPEREWKEGELPHIAGGFSPSQVSEAVNSLNMLAIALRAQRQSKGTLALNQPKLVFSLDKESGMPNGCAVYQHKESNRLIEEFMLLANMAVARRIYKAFPALALLRRHPSPKYRAADFLAAKCASLGIHLDTSSAASIQSSLNHYQGQTDNVVTSTMERMILVVLCSKIMEFARYFCTGTLENEADFIHFALNVPRYTHFTSPIRRYADVIVHRLLAHALGEGPPFSMATEEVEAQADHCNKKKKDAKTVEELSGQLFFSIFIRECGPVVQKGMVMQVLDKAFDVLVMEFGVVKRVYCERLPLQSFQHWLKGNKKIPHLTLTWESSDGGKTETKQELTIFTPVEVILLGSKQSLQCEAKIQPPCHGP